MKVDVEGRPRSSARREAVRVGEEKSRPLPRAAGSAWPPAVSAAGCVALSAIFFAGRGADAGRLPELLGALVTSLVTSPVLRFGAAGESAAGTLLAGLIVLAWYGLGAQAHRLIRRCCGEVELQGGAPRVLRLAEQAALGAGLWSLVWFGLGVCGGYRSPIAAGAVALGLALAALAWKSEWQTKAERAESQSRGRWFERAALVSVALPLGCALVAALAPPTGKDALVYRLALPLAYAAAGGFVDAPQNVYSFLALGAEMNGVWALLAGQFFGARVAEAACGAVAFAYLPLLVLTVYGWAREWRVGRAWALVAAAMVVCVPTMYQVAASGYADHALALYVALGVRAAAAWWAGGRNYHLAMMAAALGAALAVKLIAVFACLPLVVVVLLKARAAQQCSPAEAGAGERANAVLLAGLTALLGAGLLAAPWYVRTWAKTGNPVFPFYVAALGGGAPGWDAERSQLLQIFLARYGGEAKGLLDYVAAPLKLSLQAQPELASRYDGVLGVAFLAGLPLLAWGVWRGPRAGFFAEAKLTAAVAGSYYVCWLFSSQQMRFLLPALPCLAVATVAAAQAAGRWSAGVRHEQALQWATLAAVVPGLLVIAAWFAEQNPVRAATGGETREAYLTRRLEHYAYYEVVNRDLPADARLWLVNMRADTVHLKRAFVSDYVFEDYTLTAMVRATRDARELRDRVCSLGVTHVLIRHDALLDYARSPLVDERRPEAENRFRLGMLKSLLTEEARVLRSDAKYALVELKK